jgi:hypothetical protein
VVPEAKEVKESGENNSCKGDKVDFGEENV